MAARGDLNPRHRLRRAKSLLFFHRPLFQACPANRGANSLSTPQLNTGIAPLCVMLITDEVIKKAVEEAVLRAYWAIRTGWTEACGVPQAEVMTKDRAIRCKMG